MPHLPRLLLAILLATCGLLASANPARAAQSYDNCKGFIDSLPTTITTQGVWCLRKDLSTAITTGSAITIATNNVTIDCNDFKLGGLAAGGNSSTNGIYASSRLNATVRHCNVRGFYYGIALINGGGHLVEDNRLDNNLYAGIYIYGDNNQVRRNAVYDTGGANSSSYSVGIQADADILDNIVSGVFATGTNTTAVGIILTGAGNQARNNHVHGLAPTGTGEAYGLTANYTGIRVDGNHVSANVATPGYGIYGVGGAYTFCSNNTVVNFSTAYSSCDYNVNNLP